MAVGIWLAGQQARPSWPVPGATRGAGAGSPGLEKHAQVPGPGPAPTSAVPAPSAPRVAIVFDDAGARLEDVEEIIAIGRPVTVAVLPGLAHSSEVARRASAAGLEVLLHLPVEAVDPSQALGPMGVTVAMDEGQIRATVLEALQAVPGASGVSNHMGSRGTADRRVMRAVLRAVRGQGLFFLDSLTTPDSVAGAVAAEVGIPFAVRTVFLDNVNEEDAIRSEVWRLIAVARARGEAIAIGHAHRLTPRVVAQMRDEFDRQGVELVLLSALVR
jgi:polysaccharide deacetylase 2 family uncharacterized protein YibQ